MRSRASPDADITARGLAGASGYQPGAGQALLEQLVQFDGVRPRRH